jgi:hypothetical protein
MNPRREETLKEPHNNISLKKEGAPKQKKKHVLPMMDSKRSIYIFHKRLVAPL